MGVYDLPDDGTLSAQLADYVVAERIGCIAQQVIDRAKQLVADHVGLALRSLRLRETDALNAISIADGLRDGGGRSNDPWRKGWDSNPR